MAELFVPSSPMARARSAVVRRAGARIAGAIRSRRSSGTFLFGVVLPMLMVTSGAARAQATAVEPSPKAAVSQEPKPWLPTETFVLSNGLTVHFVHRPLSTTVSAGWAVKAGAADDPAGRTGLAHLVEHLLFQGTETIGTKDWSREVELLALEERLSEKALFSGDAETAELVGVRRNLARVQWPGELAKLWADGGFVGTGAITTKDFSFFTATFPKERIELWFWLEADRILNSAMRGIDREQKVVLEEALQRSGSGGRIEAEVDFDRFYWGESPYHRPTDGNPGEMESNRRADALSFYASHYAPGNLVAAVVGDLQLDTVRELPERYFGRFSSRASAERVQTSYDAVPSGGEYRAGCDCRPSVRVRFPSVAYGHRDAVALDVLAAILNGRSGRLFPALVAGQRSAFAAYATHKAQARAGSFTVVAEAADKAAGVATLERLQRALLAELSKLGSPAEAGGLRETDLARAQNVLRAEAAREVKTSDALRTRLLIDGALGDGTRLAEWPQRLESVTLEQLRRIIDTMLSSERGVTFYLSHSGAGARQQ